METLPTNNPEIELSEEEKAEVESLKDWYQTKKQEKPDASDEAFRSTIIAGLGYNLGIPGYGPEDAENPDVEPTEEQQARLEELYKKVVGSGESE